MLTLPKCDFCKKYHYDEATNKTTCEAFPDGIPRLFGWDPIEDECNNGIKFEEELNG